MIQKFLRKILGSQEVKVFSHMKEEAQEQQLTVDVFQTDDHLILLAPISGVKLPDISITVADDVLTIRGVRHHEEDAHEHQYFVQECYWGAFSRSIILPKHLKTDEINATFKNGILRIEIPKTEEAKPKVVNIVSKSTKITF